VRSRRIIFFTEDRRGSGGQKCVTQSVAP
jgi:hypothetical protein